MIRKRMRNSSASFRVSRCIRKKVSRRRRTASNISGKTYVFPKNERKLEALSLEIGEGDAVTLVVRSGGEPQRIRCGRGMWEKGRLAYGTFAEQPAAASGAWTGDDRYTVKICFYETPFCVTFNLKFSGEQLMCDADSNVGFGPAKQPQLVGEAK